MKPRCTQCGRFVPAAYLALNRWGDYGGGPLEDDTVCDACDGPAAGSPAHDAAMADWPRCMEATQAAQGATP